MSANYVARVLGYRMTAGWMEGDEATNRYFRPLPAFEERFDEIVRSARAMGFRAIDIWTAHLNPSWATPDHLEAAQRVLFRHQVEVTSLAGFFGSTAEELETACSVARELGTDVLGGGTDLVFTDRASAVQILRDSGVRLGIENHPEKTATELQEKIGTDGGGWIGAAVDTGWFATHGFDAAEALEQLAPSLLHVHLKDILPPEPTNPPGVTMKSIGHETCAFGKGVVSIQECVQTLARVGYEGAVSIEHEPEEFDPSQDVLASLRLLEGWMSDAGLA